MFWSASKIEKNHNDKLIRAAGSFNNINIDGRLSKASAIQVAGNHLGHCFIIEKTSRFLDYKNPSVYGYNVKPSEILFLF